jgi:hypothetical protein
MVEHSALRITGTRTILNPWYEFPDPVVAFDTPVDITPPCIAAFEQRSLRLLFQKNEVCFLFENEEARYLVHPIRYFLAYKTFINYNVIWPVTRPINEKGFDKCDRIPFRVQRMVQVETKRQVGEKIVRGFHYTGKDESLEITVHCIGEYLRVFNPTLYYALAFYLIGCDNPRYFLIEFYKAVEVIRKAFGSEETFLKSLAPYGVTNRKFKDFGTVCNDARRAPLDIGRHAPEPGTPFYSVDLRNLVVEPRSREILESSTTFCRQTIDAYFSFLSQKPAS